MHPAYDPLARIAREPDALEAFYRDHVEAVQRFVARRVSDPHLAADLTADVFLAAVDSAPSYDSSRGPVIAWLYGVGRNAIAAEARRRARELHAARRIEGRRLLDGAAPGPDRGAAGRRARVAPALPGHRRALDGRPGPARARRARRTLGGRRRPSAGGEAGHRAGPAAPQPGPGHRSPARAEPSETPAPALTWRFTHDPQTTGLLRVRAARRAAPARRRAARTGAGPGPSASRRLRLAAVGATADRRLAWSAVFGLGGRPAARRRTPWTRTATATSSSPCTASTTPRAREGPRAPRASTPTSATRPTARPASSPSATPTDPTARHRAARADSPSPQKATDRAT